MKIDINNALAILVGLLTVVGAIYRLAQIEADIHTRISKLESSFLEKLYETEKKLDVHLTEWAEKKEFVEYRINDTDKKIEHKFNRLANWIKQVAGYLSKEHGFQIRDDQF